jgi:Holliday junction resolvase
MNSRVKGKRGELELAKTLTAMGCQARRGQQFQGTPESPDVVCEALKGYHLEVKRTEKFRLYEAMEQAVSECGAKVPLVVHRRNRGEWLAILRLEDFMKLAQPAPEAAP